MYAMSGGRAAAHRLAHVARLASQALWTGLWCAIAIAATLHLARALL
jgi:hypothetical protein